VYLQNFDIHARPVSPGAVQHIMPNSGTYGRLDTRTIVYLTANKSEPFIFSVLGFALAYIIMILKDFCIFPVYFGYIIIRYGIWNARCKARVGVRLGKLPINVGKCYLKVLFLPQSKHFASLLRTPMSLNELQQKCPLFARF
jgi:hypothetical protein